jgi:hypothetical protein
MLSPGVQWGLPFSRHLAAYTRSTMASGAVKGLLKKVGATALATGTSLAWKRIGWPARAALMGGSFGLGAARKVNNIRHRLTGQGGKERRKLHTAAAPPTAGLPPAAAALLAQRR